jgi:hypothetical protein
MGVGVVVSVGRAVAVSVGGRVAVSVGGGVSVGASVAVFVLMAVSVGDLVPVGADVAAGEQAASRMLSKKILIRCWAGMGPIIARQNFISIRLLTKATLDI